MVLEHWVVPQPHCRRSLNWLSTTSIRLLPTLESTLHGRGCTHAGIATFSLGTVLDGLENVGPNLKEVWVLGGLVQVHDALHQLWTHNTHPACDTQFLFAIGIASTVICNGKFLRTHWNSFFKLKTCCSKSLFVSAKYLKICNSYLMQSLDLEVHWTSPPSLHPF